MNELQQVLNNIKKDKDTNLLPTNLKDGVTCLGIEGTLENKIKLFETEEEMHLDSSAQEGDLAVVYRNEVQNMKADTETQYITFPETVTLPEAFTGSFRGMLIAVDTGSTLNGNILLRETRFSFDGYSESGRISVQYNSSDGITYTRTRFSGGSAELTNPVDLGTIVKYESMESWNDALGYFMLIGGMKFDGLYEYTLNVPTNSFKLREQSSVNYNLTYAQTNPGWDKIYTGEEVFTGEDVGNKIREILKNKIRGVMFLSKDMSILYLVPTFFQYLYVYNNKLEPLVFNSADKAADITYYKYTLSDMQYEEITMTKSELGIVDDGVVANLPDDSYYLLGNTNSITTYIRWKVSDSTYYQSYIVGAGTEIEYNDKYIFANTQFTLTSSNELLPGIVGYGKNGTATGDGSIYDALNETTLLKTVTGIDGTDVNAYGYIGDVFSRLVYLTKQSKGKYILGRTEINDKSWRYQSKDGSVVCEWLSSSDFTVKKDDQLVFQLSDNAGKGYNWVYTSTNEVFYVDDDRLAILNRRSDEISIAGGGLNIFKVDMHTGETTLMATDDFFTVPSTNYTSIQSGSSTYGLAFIAAGIAKRNSPYNNYSGVKFYDAVYDKVTVIEDTQAMSNDDNLSYICPLLASTNDPRYLLICTRCYTTNNNRTTKLYRYDRETGEKELINTYNSNIDIGTSNGYVLGMIYETTDYIYFKNDQTHMYRFAKKSSYSLDQYTTDAAKIAYDVNHRLLNSDVYNMSEGVIYRFAPTDNEPKFEVVDTLNLSSNRASVNGKSYGPLYATIITDDTVKTIDTMYSKNSAVELQRYELSDKYNADTIAVNTSHSSTMHTTFVLTKDNASGPITQEQYNTALETSKQILGVKEEVQ